jgi:hypothetical protein
MPQRPKDLYRQVCILEELSSLLRNSDLAKICYTCTRGGTSKHDIHSTGHGYIRMVLAFEADTMSSHLSEGQYIADTILVPARVRSPPEDSAGTDRKRRRKVLSCYDCRRRKLQCDRIMPACGRCVKAGQASKCIFSDDAVGILSRSTKDMNTRPEDSDNLVTEQANLPSHPDTPFSDLPMKVNYQERRIQQLEAALASAMAPRKTSFTRHFDILNLPLSPTPESIQDTGPASNINDRETMLLRGKSFGTQFSGTTHPLSLIAHIPELNLFTKEALEMCPFFQRAKQDVRPGSSYTVC